MIKTLVAAYWSLSVIYYPGVYTETIDPGLQNPDTCLAQIKSEKTWPVGRMSDEMKKETEGQFKVLRPLFVGCYDRANFQEEYNLFEDIITKMPPTNKWFIVDMDDKGDIAHSGPYTLEECMEHFYRTWTGDNPVIAGCVNEPARKVLGNAIHGRFVYNLYGK